MASKNLEEMEVYEMLDNSAYEIKLTLAINKVNATDEEIDEEDGLSNKVELSKKQIKSFPIDISVIQEKDGEQQKLKTLEKAIPVTIEIPIELRDRQWYKIIRIHEGKVSVLDTEKNGNLLTFYTDQFSTYFILAGPASVMTRFQQANTDKSIFTIKNPEFIVPYYHNNPQEIEPLSDIINANYISMLRYIGDKPASALYRPRFFKDIYIGHYNKSYIDFLNARNIFEGCIDGENFNGKIEVTRAEAVRLIMNFTPNIKLSSDSHFKDVKPYSPYFTYINTAYEMGFISGNKGKFHPDRTITKEELAVMVYNYFKINGLVEDNKNTSVFFKDMNEISSWSLDAIKYMANTEIMLCDGFGKIKPKGTVNRFMISVVLTRTIKHLVNEKYKNTYRISSIKDIDNYQR